MSDLPPMSETDLRAMGDLLDTTPGPGPALTWNQEVRLLAEVDSRGRANDALSERLAAKNAELDRVIREAAANKARALETWWPAETAWFATIRDEKDVSLVQEHSKRMRQALGVMPGMPHTPTEAPEAAVEYRCPDCDRWAEWTDGVVDGDDEGVQEFWCQTCGSQTPIENMESRPQETDRRGA